MGTTRERAGPSSSVHPAVRSADGFPMRPRWLAWPKITAPKPGDPMPPLWQRLAWMAGIWLASIAALLLVAQLLRWVLKS
jgi:hypothetical protein